MSRENDYAFDVRYEKGSLLLLDQLKLPFVFEYMTIKTCEVCQCVYANVYVYVYAFLYVNVCVMHMHIIHTCIYTYSKFLKSAT